MTLCQSTSTGRHSAGCAIRSTGYWFRRLAHRQLNRRTP